MSLSSVNQRLWQEFYSNPRVEQLPTGRRAGDSQNYIWFCETYHKILNQLPWLISNACRYAKNENPWHYQISDAQNLPITRFLVNGKTIFAFPYMKTTAFSSLAFTPSIWLKHCVSRVRPNRRTRRSIPILSPRPLPETWWTISV